MEVQNLIKRIYSGQVHRSRKRNHPPPEYSYSEFYIWIIQQDLFHELFYNYVSSGKVRDLVPSVDRKNMNIHYKFSNIELMTWKENRDNFFIDVKNRVSGALCRSVIQMDLNGDLIKIHLSITDAINETGIWGIMKNLKGWTKQVGGFKFMYGHYPINEKTPAIS